MDRAELRKKLEEHLSFLQKTAKNAAELDRYGEAAELSKQILETVEMLDDL